MSHHAASTNVDIDQTHPSLASHVRQPVPSPVDALTPNLNAPYGQVTKKFKSSEPSKDSLEPPLVNTSNWSANLRFQLNKARSTLKAAASDTKKLIDNTSDSISRDHLFCLLGQTDIAFRAVDALLTKNGNIANLPNFTPTEAYSSKSVSTTDASTDMMLTPGHWDSDTVIESKAAFFRRRARKTKVPGSQLPQDTEADTAMETDAEDWSKVVSRRSKSGKKQTTTAIQPTASLRPHSSGFSNKPPAILIRNSEGKNYNDTILAVRNCGLTREEIGTNVTMRQTRDGCLLLELPKGGNSITAAKRIVSAMSLRLGDSVGKVLQLGVLAEVEVLDIDAAATATEVLEALRDAIPGQEDPEAKIDRDVISDLRIWGTRSGQQIATAKMPKNLAIQITRVPIGWTMCRVRPRTQPPERCYRCQAFGHNTRTCTAEDRTGACWKCGSIGHSMKDCKEADDRCIACEIAGLQRVPHKPGSGACAARRQSAGTGLR